MDPQFTSNGEPYAPVRFKEIVRERYLISKHCNTSYKDLDSISPAERSMLLEFIYEELKKQQDAIEEAKNKK